MNIIQLVYGSLKWKRSDSYCSTKLGISLEDYQEIKAKILVAKNDLEDDLDLYMLEAITSKLEENDVTKPNEQLLGAAQDYKNKVIEFKENLDEGTAELKGIAVVEPKSPEEIIRILKIDETKWKLSSYWNKQHRDHWLISAMVSRIKQEPKDLLLEAINKFKPQYTPIKEVHINDRYDAPVIGVLSIQDLHFGKEGSEGVVQDFKDAVSNLVIRGYHSHKLHKIIYVFGGDLLNMDTFSGQTTKGTVVDNEMKAQDAYLTAFDALYWSVNHISQFCNELEVLYLPGNHDRLSSFHLAHALSKCFNSSKILFNVGYSERKVVTWGENFFAFEHGDVSTKTTPLVYATEFSQEWGNTQYRTCYTGHWHKKKTMEYVTEDEQHGFAIKHLPSLCKTDYWHYHNKYTGSKRQAVMEIHDLLKGKVCELTYTV